MAWWNRVKKTDVSRELEIPKVDGAKLEILKVSKLKPLSEDDRSIVKDLKKELVASGFLDRDEPIEFKPIDDNIEQVFNEAGKQGIEATSQLPTYNFELDDEISAGEGGANFLLDELDDYDDPQPFDVFTIGKTNKRVSIKETDGAIEVRLPNGTVVKGRPHNS